MYVSNDTQASPSEYGCCRCAVQMLSCLGTATYLLDVPKQPTCMNTSPLSGV